MARRHKRHRAKRNSSQKVGHSLLATLTRDFNTQDTCPLFSRIPPELRREIFVLTLTSYDDESRPYPPTAYYTRKGYHYYQNTHTALLATCRRIYSETHDLPLSLNEHVFWCYRGPQTQTYTDPRIYFSRMTLEQRDAVNRVHFFIQLYWLRDSFSGFCTLPEMRPNNVKITIRHSDWWFWEQNERLNMEEPTWAKNLKMIESLEGLEIEIETMERDKDQQLESIVQTMLKWKFNLFDGRVLTTNGTEIIHDRWVGQSSFDGEYRYNFDEGEWDMIAGLTTDVYGPEPGLPYHVITLRWQPEVQTH
ncbi:hypothetical protein K443DRAFT_683256 [Laccaria amethystina LaAM-08-1]|uniref:Uncharacterized protein n=1 Tax=Laccaria amethystina LaAM-08-1 TaxID=1095629 RepID=A0A0C9XG92_9AGAR|nr:hypothetical protein K443DRAFT_683256 [Laccaria amethystina LaAM-08-1]